MKKSKEFYDIIISYAYENEDFNTVDEAFMDILDYKETILSQRSYNIVLSANPRFFKDIVMKELIEVK